MGISLTTCKRDMNLAPIIFATLVVSAFAAMPLKPDDALTGLLDEEPATPNKMKPAPTSLIDAFLDTKSKTGCVNCYGRERASDEEASGMSGRSGCRFATGMMEKTTRQRRLIVPATGVEVLTAPSTVLNISPASSESRKRLADLDA